LVEWILRDRIAFLQVESESWQQLIVSLRPDAISYIPKSGDTIRAWALEHFKDAKVIVNEHLKCSISKIHISCDMWSSPNGYAFLGIVGHWCDIDHNLQTALLALPRVTGAHSGVNIAAALVTALDSYEVSNNLGYIMLDNATNNDTTVESIINELESRGIITSMTALEMRLRCIGHIINLVVKALLFGKDTFALEMDTVEFATWRKIGAIGKLHNIIRYIRASPQRRERFLTIQLDILQTTEAFVVRQNNDTRWNSTYNMIDRALKLRKSIEQFTIAAIANRELTKAEREQLDSDQLSSEEWMELTDLYALLQPFQALTMEVQGNIQGKKMNGAIFDYLPAMDLLLKGLEDAKKKYTLTKSPFASCINLAWKKLDEYYRLSDESPIYMVAVILDPRLKLQYFERKWRTRRDWIEMARNRFQRMYHQYCGDIMTSSTSNGTSKPPSSTPKVSTLMSWKFEANIPSKSEDELEDYLQSQTEPSYICPREWWEVNGERFPVLAQMAWNIFAVPAMSAEVERIFSGYDLFHMTLTSLERNY
jgi:hypothetical protein